MIRKLFIFEDDKFENFYPLTYNRPVYELLCGIRKVRDKLIRLYPEAEVVLLCRGYLADVLSRKSLLRVNRFNIKKEDQLLFLNGRILADDKFQHKINFSERIKLIRNGDTLLAISLKGEDFNRYEDELKSLYKKEKIISICRKIKPVKKKVNILNFLWDLIELNAMEIKNDFTHSVQVKKRNFREEVESSIKIYNPQQVYIGKNSRIEAFVVLDARDGPIYIGEDTAIQSPARIEGPAYIGANT
ncbi:MAG: putative sugar nucleotidyl transferase, partial [candidate division Zixibacteria bacterium]|nr:putative sugar nucleotidyl transferase [candidate division Zixibacteria bacterium]